MKKKGLIISTVVMVVVLIASLTTATYAWFSVSTKTTIDGFNLQVVAGNAVNIGLRKDLTKSYNSGDLDTEFTTGDVSFDGGTAGTLFSGQWTGGTDGFGPQLIHHITFGDVQRAVAFTTAEVDKITDENTSYMPSDPSGYKVVSAAKSATNNDLIDKQAARANGYTPTEGDPVNGDYAYLWLGVSPAKTLKEGAILHVYVKSDGTGTKLGIAAAVHVAYSINGRAWTDVDAFEGKDYKTEKTAAQTKMAVDATEAFDSTAKKGSIQNGMADVAINLTKTTAQAEFDQVQVVVYLAGNDPDCNDNAKGVTAKIGMYFETIDESITEKSAFGENASAAIDGTGSLTVTNGKADSVVEYSITDGVWVKVNGSWNGTTFTSATKLAATKNTTVKVRIREIDKLSSDPIVAQNSFK